MRATGQSSAKATSGRRRYTGRRPRLSRRAGQRRGATRPSSTYIGATGGFVRRTATATTRTRRRTSTDRGGCGSQGEERAAAAPVTPGSVVQASANGRDLIRLDSRPLRDDELRLAIGPLGPPAVCLGLGSADSGSYLGHTGPGEQRPVHGKRVPARPPGHHRGTQRQFGQVEGSGLLVKAQG